MYVIVTVDFESFIVYKNACNASEKSYNCPIREIVISFVKVNGHAAAGAYQLHDNIRDYACYCCIPSPLSLPYFYAFDASIPTSFNILVRIFYSCYAPRYFLYPC